MSRPGRGQVIGARVLGDDPGRYASAKARKNYAGTSLSTCASEAVTGRYVHNNRLADALRSQAFATLQPSPGARA